jgi:Uma2 family endonuclease
MATLLVIEEKIEIPMNLHSLADFRAWALSGSFPETGRIDYIDGRIEVDMSPEELFSHGNLKVRLIWALNEIVEQNSLGYLFTDSSRVSSPDAELSAEPDIVFLSHEALDNGRATLVPKASGESGRYVEIEGAVDLVVEIVSDSSVTKDNRRLPAAYFRAGVQEFWLVDAWQEPVQFQVFHRGERSFAPVEPDAAGFQQSQVLASHVRLEEERDVRGIRRFRLESR